MAAGLLGRSLQALGHADLGYRTEHVLRMAMTIDDRDAGDAADMPVFLDRLRATLTRYPRVTSVGLSWQALPPGYETSRRIRFDGMPPAFDAEGLPVGFHAVDPGLLPTLDIEILAGRNVSTSDDAEGRRVVLLCASLADMMGPREHVLGRTLEYDGEQYTVIGVVADVMHQGPVKRRAQDLDVYVPMAQDAGRTISIAIQTADDPAEYIAPLRQSLAALAPASPQHWISTMRSEISDDLGGPLFYVALVGAFAASALSLTAVGLFALIAYQITRQRPEFGVRRAIGAGRPHIYAVVAGRGLRPVCLGLGVGVLASVPAGRMLGASLYGIAPFDWVTFAGGASVVLLVAVAATGLCAVAAGRISPLEALEEA